MNVFISWSGSKSEAVAGALGEWLPGVINELKPFVSSRDIYAGTRWQSEIASQLGVSNFGIVCVTSENQGAPWLNFEAGALAKALDVSRLIPLAVDLKPSDVEVPLGQFQAQPATEEGIRAIVVSLNDALGEQGLADDLLRNSFDVWWPRLKERLAAIEQETTTATPPARSERQLLEETLDTVRAVARAVDEMGLRPTFGVGRSRLELDRVARLLDSLPSREREIIALRFGLEGEPMTLAEIGSIVVKGANIAVIGAPILLSSLVARRLGGSVAWPSRFSTSLCVPFSAHLFVAAVVCISRTSSCWSCGTSSRSCVGRSCGRSSGWLIGRYWPRRRVICRARRVACAW
jgi:Sigma-70, region 4/TIR domain